MKKVLYVTNLPAPYKVEFFNLLSANIDLTVVYERKKASDRDDKWVSQRGGQYKEIYLQGKEIGNEASLSFQIIKILKSNKYDVVIMNGYSSPTAIIAIAYMHLRGIKYAIICDGMLPTKDSKAKLLLKKFLIGNTSYCLSSGKITDEQLVKYGAIASRIYRYPFSSISENDIQTEWIDKAKYKNLIGCKSQRMLLFVGQFIERKGIDVLFEAIASLDMDFQLFMVGGTREQASRFKGYDNPHIEYCGFKNKEELSDYYKAADVFVLPTREDIWGLVINEAMSYGLPVITTKKCGAGLEMVADERQGLLIQSESSEELNSAISRLLAKGQAHQDYITETARKFIIEKMAGIVVKTIEDQ